MIEFPVLAFCEAAHNALKLFGIPISAGLPTDAISNDSVSSVPLIIVTRTLAYLPQRAARLRLCGKLIRASGEICGRAW
jgi:hypothetical protein